MTLQMKRTVNVEKCLICNVTNWISLEHRATFHL